MPWHPLWHSLWPEQAAGRVLIGFWGALLLLLAGVVAALLWLGPPASQIAAPARAVGIAARTTVQTAAPPGPRRTIAPPDPALLEASGLIPAGSAPDDAAGAALLPRMGPDGRTPATAYASPAVAPPPGSIRVAVLLDGVGLSAEASLDAIDRLPAAVSLAVSPYAPAPEPILQAARRRGHEYLLSLPMEPNRSPLDDEGSMQLSTRSSDTDNAHHLAWSLSRIRGYAGFTNQSAGLSGERYAESVDFDDVAQGLARRGLFYVDASPGAVAPAVIAGATADVRIAGAANADSLDRVFLQAEQTARDKGSALIVVGPLYPVTVARLDRWSRSLAERGLVLVPVSQLVHKADANAAGTRP